MLIISELSVGDKIRECASFLGIRRKGQIIDIQFDRILYTCLDKKYCNDPMYAWSETGIVFITEFMYWEKY